MPCEDYLIASSVEEALATLACMHGEARLIAGGTDLYIQLMRNERRVETLVDITRIPGLSEIRQEHSLLTIGACVTWSEIERSPMIRARATVLAQAAAHIGGPQIRNVGTIAGNVVNAQPAADGSIALLALDAEAEIANLTGRQWVPLRTLFIRPGVSRVDAGAELVTGFRFRAHGPREASAYERIARRRALALPVLNVAARVLLDASRENIRDAWVAIGPVALVPFRAEQTEAALRGQPATADTIAEAARVAVSESRPRSSLLRASKGYRRELIAVLVRRALQRAINDARK